VNRIERLLHNYERHVSLPWSETLSGSQKVWFAVYDKNDDQRLRTRIEGFELATRRVGKRWRLCDLTNSFPEWMAGKEYKESYFESPEDLDLALSDFLDYASSIVLSVLNDAHDKDEVVALLGVATLFGFIKVSDLVNALHPQVQGRLLVFFPGEYENGAYRLLDARDGWNYLAVPITHHERIQAS
jgi:hypothetical protein